MMNRTPKYPNHLARFRRLKRLRYKQVARAIGIKATKTIALWERGDIMPNGKYLLRLSCLYGKTLEEMYPLEEQKCPTQPKNRSPSFDDTDNT
jgi:transcriptional regulator with XRE-family HTH domain